MDARFYLDPETGDSHVRSHGVEEYEVMDVLESSGEDRAGQNGTRIAIGQTRAGRYLRVVYVPDQAGEVFVITAYDLRGSRATHSGGV